LSSLKERHSRRKLGHSLLRSKLHIKHQITTPDASTTARSDQDQAQILKRHRKDFNIFNCASTIQDIKVHQSTMGDSQQSVLCFMLFIAHVVERWALMRSMVRATGPTVMISQR
jgi:hypothetical protein